MTPKSLALASEEGRRPTWEMALIYPDQGGWTVDDYLALDIGRHVDFANGWLEFQRMPDEKHQAIVFFLVQALKIYALRNGGRATMAPFPINLWEQKFREPDVASMRKQNLHRCQKKHWVGADFVAEVLSEANRDLDLETKPIEYAKAGISEYWIVDPEKETITVLRLEGSKYVTSGVFHRGQIAVSTGLPDFQVDVTAVMDAV